MITVEIVMENDHILTAEGEEIVAKGSHEALVWAALPMQGQGEAVSIPELKVKDSICSKDHVVRERNVDVKSCFEFRNVSETMQWLLDKEELSKTNGYRRKGQDS